MSTACGYVCEIVLMAAREKFQILFHTLSRLDSTEKWIQSKSTYTHIRNELLDAFATFAHMHNSSHNNNCIRIVVECQHHRRQF